MRCCPLTPVMPVFQQGCPPAGLLRSTWLHWTLSLGCHHSMPYPDRTLPEDIHPQGNACPGFPIRALGCRNSSPANSWGKKWCLGKLTLIFLWVPGGCRNFFAIWSDFFLSHTRNYNLYYVLHQGSGVSKEKRRQKPSSCWIASPAVARPYKHGSYTKIFQRT